MKKMYGDKIITIGEKHGMNGQIKALRKSPWKCPICGKRMYYPELFDKKGDFDCGTDICMNHGIFQIRQIT